MEQFVVHIWDGVSVGGFIVYDSDQPASQPASSNSRNILRSIFSSANDIILFSNITLFSSGVFWIN
jgi:hypothetical protein